MDNKNNRLFYWNVKDFLNKSPDQFEVKKESLKESINNVLSSNKIFRQSNFSTDMSSVDVTSKQIELISEDQKKYVSKKTNDTVNSLSNPFSFISLQEDATSGAPASLTSTGPQRIAITADMTDDEKIEAMIKNHMASRGIKIPVFIESGRNKNFNEWKQATDARNAAMRETSPILGETRKTLYANLNAARKNKDLDLANKLEKQINDVNYALGKTPDFRGTLYTNEVIKDPVTGLPIKEKVIDKKTGKPIRFFNSKTGKWEDLETTKTKSYENTPMPGSSSPVTKPSGSRGRYASTTDGYRDPNTGEWIPYDQSPEEESLLNRGLQQVRQEREASKQKVKVGGLSNPAEVATPSGEGAIIDIMKAQSPEALKLGTPPAEPAAPAAPAPTGPGRKNQPPKIASALKDRNIESLPSPDTSAPLPAPSAPSTTTSPVPYAPITYVTSAPQVQSQIPPSGIASNIQKLANSGAQTYVGSNVTQISRGRGFNVGMPLGMEWEKPTELVSDTPANTDLYNWFMKANAGRTT
jgi:hypothetical protein